MKLKEFYIDQTAKFIGILALIFSVRRYFLEEYYMFFFWMVIGIVMYVLYPSLKKEVRE